MMECEEYRGESEIEADSDHEDGDGGGGGSCGGDSGGGWLGHPLHNFHTDLDSYETGTVRRRTKTIVTPKMAMESFRLSFLNDDQDVNFDAILGELYELESQLSSTQTELSRSLGTGGQHPPPPAAFQDGGEGTDSTSSGETIRVSEQEELDQLAAEITRGLHYHKANGHYHPHHHHQQHHLTVASPGGEGLCDTAETDSAFSDNASLPSSESFTSMVTVSSSADTTSSSSGETCSMSSAMCAVNHAEEEQIARLKAEKIRIALEKIKEAKIRKLFVRAFAKDGSSKSILVDEKMSVGQVCSQLADKNHMRLNHKLAVVEHMPELLMERILEDHDSLVENMVMWTKDSKNKIMFVERMDKYDLFRTPEKYLLSSTAMKQGPLASQQKDKLIQEFFAPENVCVPSVEGALYLKSDGKKAWKKFFFVLRASGLYYNPKGKASKNPKDLVCLVQFEYVEVYRGLGWKKKYHAPTDFCFALKHPQIQKKTSKYIRYFCAETESALDQWVMGMRTVKLGKQMLHNYERLTHEISMWDMRQPECGGVTADEPTCQMLNHTDLSDSRMSVPEPGSRHSVIQVHSSSRSSSISGGDGGRDTMSIEVLAIPPRKGSESGAGSDGRSLSGSIGSSSAGSESGHKTPVKRVSFSATHSIINGDSGETVKHRDSIISASTDSSEDSNSSGETRLGTNFRGSKMRARLPLTTETTRQLADMCNVSMDETPEAIYAETHHHRAGSSSAFARADRRRASMQERRGSCGSAGSDTSQRLSHVRHSPLGSSIKQHSMDSESMSSRGRQGSPGPEGHYQHVRRKSEPSVTGLTQRAKVESPSSTYSALYSPLREDRRPPGSTGHTHLCNSDQEHSEPLYNRIRSPPPTGRPHKASSESPSSAIPPPPQFREVGVDSNHIGKSAYPEHEPSPPPLPPLQLESMQTPPPLPPDHAGLPPPPPSQTAYNQQNLPQQEPQYSSVAPPAPSNHSKCSPPPTLPKPQSSNSSASSTPTPTAGLPKHPPPPPLRLCSNESTCSSLSGMDSASGSPLHIPMPPPMAPITPKLPPPTMPKSSYSSSVAALGNIPKPSSPPVLPPGDVQCKKLNGPGEPTQARLNGQHGAPAGEVTGCPTQSPSLPFLSELSKRTHSESGADSPGVELRNGQPSASVQQHRRSASAGGMVSKGDKKTVPPPPPKRNENTRLSTEVAKQQQQQQEMLPNGGSALIHDPIYENFDGMLDIDDLPPPPPELLDDFPPPECDLQRSSGSSKKAKPPPPPPKRSKDTQLSSH